MCSVINAKVDYFPEKFYFLDGSFKLILVYANFIQLELQTTPYSNFP